MAQQDQSKYVQGYSDRTTSTQEKRTAELEAAFLLPHIEKSDPILDVGCGPGTITTGLARLASEGTTVGIDISPTVLAKAKALAADAQMLTTGPGSVTFEEGDVLGRLAYPDETFDVVFASQVFGHLRPPHEPLQALAEICRVLKPGGVLATRDGGAQHFYPSSLDLDRLWAGNLQRAVVQGAPVKELTGTIMPALLRRAGFDTDEGKVRVGAGTTVYAGRETREWLGGRAAGQLQKGTDDVFRQSWLDAGISEAEIEETLDAVRRWVETEDAWFVSLQCEMLAWK